MGEWISVEDRLPKNGGWYLVVAGLDGFGPEGVATMAFLDPDPETGEMFWLPHNDADRWSYDEWVGVTHWMPLPDPPEPHQGRGGGDA